MFIRKSPCALLTSMAALGLLGCGSALRASQSAPPVTPTAPAAAFSFSPAAPVTNQSVPFTDKSTGSPTSWSWNFGDNTTSTAQNPTHTNLQQDTQYYYRLYFQASGHGAPSSTSEFSFHTVRPAGSAFTFDIQGDSHPERADPLYALNSSDAYLTGDKVPSTGYTRVTDSPSGVKVEYVRTWLPADQSATQVSGSVAFRYTTQ